MTENNKKDRFEMAKKDAEILENTSTELETAKKLLQEDIDKAKSVCVSLDNWIFNVQIGKALAESLTQENVDKMPASAWSEYERLTNLHFAFFDSASQFRRDMEGRAGEMANLDATAETFVAASGTSAGSAYCVFDAFSVVDPSVATALEKVQIEETWLQDIEFIKQELPNIYPDALKNFESVIEDWSGTGDPDLKHKALLDLRSVIFYQILDDLADQTVYSQTSWYRAAQAGTIASRKRFCQVKFLIVGNQDESKLPSSMVQSIDLTATALQISFDNMSEYGKRGETGIAVENCYKETITSFANALRLKSKVQGATP